MATLKSILNLRNLERVNAVIEKNIHNINLPLDGPTDPIGQTVLFGAISRGLHRHVELLIKHGADVNYKDKCGRTPIMMCNSLLSNRFMIIDYLRQAGADFTIVNNFKENLLGMAIDVVNFPLVEKLVEDGIYQPREINFLARRGFHSERIRILKYLLALGFTIPSVVIPICLKSVLISQDVESLSFFLKFYRPPPLEDSTGNPVNDSRLIVDSEILDVQNKLIVKQHHASDVIKVIYPYLTVEQQKKYAIRAIVKENYSALETLLKLGLNPDIRTDYDTHTNITLLEFILLLHGIGANGVMLARVCLKYGESPMNQRKLFFSGRRQNVEELIDRCSRNYPYPLTECCLIQIRKKCIDISKLPVVLSQSIFDS